MAASASKKRSRELEAARRQVVASAYSSDEQGADGAWVMRMMRMMTLRWSTSVEPPCRQQQAAEGGGNGQVARAQRSS